MAISTESTRAALESRIASTEAELNAIAHNVDSLTVDVRSLAASVRQQSDQFSAQMRQQGEQVAAQIQQLHVAVTSAAGPRKTDWSVLLAAAGLVLTITAAVGSSYLAPVNTTLNFHEKVLVERGLIIGNNQDRLRKLETDLVSMQTVFQARLDQLNRELDDVRIHGSPLTRERLAILEASKDQLMKIADELRQAKTAHER